MSIDPKKISTLVNEVRNELGTGDDELILKRREQQLVRLVEQGVRRVKSGVPQKNNSMAGPTFRRTYWIAAAAAVLIGTAGLLLFNRANSPSPDSFFEYTVTNADTTGGENQWILAPQKGNAEIKFVQGSRFAIKDNGAVRILSHTPKLVHIELHTGQLNSKVKGNGITNWKISAGPFQLSVLGTQFNVDWNLQKGTLRVQLQKGVVLVQGGSISDHGIRLYAGHTLAANSLDGTFEVTTGKNNKKKTVPEEIATSNLLNPSTVNSKASAENFEDEFVAPSQLTPSGAKHAAKTPRWLTYYKKDDFHMAQKAIESAGLSRLLQTASAQDLWKISQIYRHIGDSVTTNRALLQIRKRYPASSKAKISAFILGRNMMEQQHNSSQAAAWFEQYIKESPNGTMIQEAYNRLFSAYSSSGQTQRTVDAADRYLKKFPNGVYVSKAKQINHQ